DWRMLAHHSYITLYEAAIGLICGVSLGFIAATLMDRFEGIYLALEPIITLTQTIPTIAIAPLLVLWFGFGLLPKVILVVLTTFFPVAIALIQGFKSVDPDMIELMQTMKANRFQIFWHVKLPAALPQFFSGLRISATYAIVGAVVAEWLGGMQGLGVYMTRVRKSFLYDKMFAVILVTSALSLLLMKAIDVLQHVSMPWKRNRKD
ncbi:MAG: ABC transporter permease, partial [Eggerthellaceae bacterium]|nr:ABC transporter permease [Eggerthellaceae bacterium]